METITLTNRDALVLYRTIHAVGDVVAPVRWTYALGRTRRALQPVVESIEAAQQAQHARYLEIAKAHAELGEDGQPVQVTEEGRTGYRVDPAKQEAFAAAVKGLSDELAELLAESVDVAVHRVPLEAVPDLTGAQVDALLPMIADG